MGVAQVIKYEIHTTNSVERASVVSAESLNNVIVNGRCSLISSSLSIAILFARDQHAVNIPQRSVYINPTLSESKTEAVVSVVQV